MNLLEMSIAGSILIVGIIIFRAVLIHRISKKILIVLWGIAIVRLLLPIALTFNLPGIGMMTSNVGKEWGNVAIVEKTFSTMEKATIQEHREPTKISNRNGNDNQNRNVIWIFGFFCIVLYMMKNYVRDKRFLKMAIPLLEKEENFFDIVHNKILVSDRIVTPITYGVLTPVIILPKEMDLTNKELLTYVLNHEMIHIKYHDNLLKLILVLTVCIHWYNPLVWVMWVLCQRDLELRCDEEVIHRVGRESKKEYALTLLNLAEQKGHGFLIGVGFGKKAIKERIEAIMKYKKATVIGMFVTTMVITASLTAFITTNAAEKVGTYEEGGKLEEEWKKDAQAYADRFAEYGVSISMSDTDYQFYYKEEPVCFVADNKATGGSFSGSVYFNADGGAKGVITLRNGAGEVTGMQLLTEEETKKYNKYFW